MLHNEARNLLIAGYVKTKNVHLIASAYSVSERTVYRLMHQKQETGSVDLRTSQRCRKPVLSEEDKAHISQCLEENPDVTIEEIREKLQLNCRAGGRGNGIHAEKRSPSTQLSMTAPDVRQKCEEWNQTIGPELADKLVFLDESGINTDMTPTYGRGKRSERVVDNAPLKFRRCDCV